MYLKNKYINNTTKLHFFFFKKQRKLRSANGNPKKILEIETVQNK